MDIKQYLNEHFAKIFKKLGYDVGLANVTFSSLPQISDFQCNASFALAKIFKCNPMEIANKIVSACGEIKKDYDIFATAPAFVNIKLKNKTLSAFANYALNAKSLVKKHDKKLSVIMDYGGANVAKELHVGHLRSPIIGESLARLYRLFGHKVITDTHLGDWGLQMGLTIAQLEEDGYLDYYFNKSKTKKEITLNTLNVTYPKANLRKNEDKKFYKKAEDYTLFLQQKKEPYFSVWKAIREISVNQIKKNYKELNANFDLWYGESDASDYISVILDIFKSKNLTRISDGAVVVDIAKEGEHIPMPKKDPDEVQKYLNPMPPAIIQKFNGGELYVTTDIATIYKRNLQFKCDEIIYLTDKRQQNHFEQVFRCVRLANILPESKKLLHIGFGTMNGKDGKPFKTREGTTIKLDDIVNLLKDKAREKLEQNNIKFNSKLPLQIGVAAMKFGDLSNSVTKDYVFDLDKFTAFEGKTGPYLQYTLVRIKSLIKKSNKNFGDIIIEHNEQKNILISILKLTESYSECFANKSLNTLCEAAYNLASDFSTFYNNTKILTETDLKKQASYLSLCQLVYANLAQALKVLAIDIPSKM